MEGDHESIAFLFFRIGLTQNFNSQFLRFKPCNPLFACTLVNKIFYWQKYMSLHLQCLINKYQSKK